MNIDTNILIAYFAGEERVTSLIGSFRTQGIYLYTSIIAETELLSFDGWTSLERSTVKQFLKENFISLPYTRELIESTVQVRTSTKLKLPDAIIAATALHTETPLLTRNVKNFKKVKGLKVLTI